MSKKIVEKNPADMSMDELMAARKTLIETRTELAVKKNAGQLEKPHMIKQVRRAIANLKRLIHVQFSKK